MLTFLVSFKVICVNIGGDLVAMFLLVFEEERDVFEWEKMKGKCSFLLEKNLVYN